MQKTRKVKAENEVIYSFMPENANLRNARDVTLNVLDMLSNDVESSRSGNLSRDSDDQLFPNSFGNNEDNLVDSYLEQTSLVDCAAASIPLKEKKIVQKKKKKKRNNRRKVNKSLRTEDDITHLQWVYKYSSVCAARTGQFRWPDDCHKFVDCWRGQGTLKSCFPRSLVFNEATGQCDWPL